MFLTVLCIVAKYWKQKKCPSTGKWIYTLWYIHTMEYYSAIIRIFKKPKELLIHTAWINPKNYADQMKPDTTE